MKFHCEACNTRYSIADERVRGKILKVRCKNCSAVITVREGMSETPAGTAPDGIQPEALSGRHVLPQEPVRTPSQAQPVRRSSPQNAVRAPSPQQPVRRSSPQNAVRAPSHEPSSSGPMRAVTATRQETMRPPPLEPAQAEPIWYVSRDGEQNGPLSLAQAREWIASRGAGAPIYCWREGFADWKAVTTVPEFRNLGMPRAPSASLAPSLPRAPSAPARAATPAPARAATPASARAATPAPARAATPAPARAAIPTPAPAPAESAGVVAKLADDAFSAAAGDDLELAIDEPSRIVKLDMLQAYQNASTRSRGTGAETALPGSVKPAGSEQGALRPSRGTGAVAAMGHGSGTARPLADMGTDSAVVDNAPGDKRRRSSMLLIFGVVGVLCAGATALAVMVLRSADSRQEGTLTGNVPSDFENLGYQFDRPERRKPGQKNKGSKTVSATTTAQSPQARGPRRRSDKGDKGSENGSSGTTSNSGAASGQTQPRDTGRSSYSGDDPVANELTPLSPDDVIRQSSRSQFGFQRCYERAKKKDPFFEVKSLTIDLKVNAAGEVTGVSLSNYEDSLFGKCMTARIQRWTFRASTNGIHTQLPVKFER